MHSALTNSKSDSRAAPVTFCFQYFQMNIKREREREREKKDQGSLTFQCIRHNCSYSSARNQYYTGTLVNAPYYGRDLGYTTSQYITDFTHMQGTYQRKWSRETVTYKSYNAYSRQISTREGFIGSGSYRHHRPSRSWQENGVSTAFIQKGESRVNPSLTSKHAA